MKTNFNIQKEIISHLKSSARVYQGYSKGIRFVASILVLLWIGVGNVWGATATNNCNSAIPGTATLMETGKQIKWSVSSTNTYSNPVRVYANTTVTFAANTGYKITKVVVTASSTGNYVTYTKDATWSATGTGTCSVGKRTVSSKDITANITGTATQVTIKPSSQTRWSKVVVTYESTSAAQTCVLKDGVGGTSTHSGTYTCGTTALPEATAVSGWTFYRWSAVQQTIASSNSSPGTLYASGATNYTQTTLYALYMNDCDYTYCTAPSVVRHIMETGNPDIPGSTNENYITITPQGGSENQYCNIPVGTRVNIVATPNSESSFSSWTITKYGDESTTVTPDASTASTYFTMPDYNVSVTANFCSDLSTASAPTVSVSSATYNTSTSKWDITVNWTAVTGATYYKIACANLATETYILNATDVGNVLTYNISGLTQDETHRIRVQARNNCNSTYKNGDLDYTPTCPALTATTVSYGTKTSTSIVVNWTAVSGADKYTLVVQKRNSADDGWESTPAARFDDLTVLTKTITGLTPNTKYRANVQAISDCGSTKATAGASFTTLAQYTVHFDGNGATGGSVPSDAVKDAGSSYSLPGVGTLTNTGYTFGGWLEGSTSGTLRASGYSHTVNADITFYAKWTIQSYDVTFNMHDHGSAVAKQTIEYNGLVTEPSPAPSDADWKFGGWYKEAGYSNLWNFATDHVTAATTLHAKWTAKTYTNYRTTCSETYDIVLHDNNGGSHNGSAKVAADGKQLTSIVAPTRDGYSVEGYYAEAGTSTKIADASGVLQSDKTGYTDATGAWTKGEGATLYAKWTATNYTITYDGLEGASNSNPTSYTIATPTITLVAPGSREGYTFAGWTCGGSPITQIAVGSTGDKTITATWTANTYTVRFNANGGSGSMSPQNFTYGVAQNLTSNSFTHATKSFGGWTTNADGTGTEYSNGQSVSNLTSENGATVQLYAKWVDCELYTVTLMVNTDTYQVLTQPSCGAAVSLTGIEPPTCGSDYTFVGWSTTNPGTTTSPTITTSYNPGTSNKTLYAVYSKSDYIDWRRIESTGDLSTWDTYIITSYDSDRAMNATQETNNRHHTEITKSADKKTITSVPNTVGQFMIIEDGSNWNIYDMNAAGEGETDVYLIASGGSSSNKLTLTDDDTNGNAEWSISITDGAATVKAQGDAARNWMLDNSGTFTCYESKRSSYKLLSFYKYVHESATTYTTKPEITLYTVNKGAEDAAVGTYTVTPGLVCSGSSVSLSATPTGSNTFIGWESDNGGTFANASSATTTFTPSATTTTVTANFGLAIVLDKNNADGGSADGSAYVTANATSLSSVSAPTRTGYTVEGYYAEDGCTHKVADNAGALQDNVTGYTGAGGAWTKGTGATLYAKWTANPHTLTWNFDGGESSLTAGVGYTAGGTVNYGTAITYPTNVSMTKTGYTFSGWSTSVSSMPDDNLTITALWTQNNYTLTMATNPADKGANITSPRTGAGTVDNKHYGDAITVTVTKPDHYTFSGWTSSNGGTFANASALSTTFTMPDNATTVTANFTEDAKFTVTWSDNGDASNTTQVYSGGTTTFPALEGCDMYVAAGWVLDDGTFTEETAVKPGTIYAVGATTPAVSGNVTYKAVYRHKYYTTDEFVLNTTTAGGYYLSVNPGTVRYSGAKSGSKLGTVTNKANAVPVYVEKEAEGQYSFKLVGVTDEQYIVGYNGADFGWRDTKTDDYKWNVAAGTQGKGDYHILNAGTNNTRGFIYNNGSGNYIGNYAGSNVTSGGSTYYDMNFVPGYYYKYSPTKACYVITIASNNWSAGEFETIDPSTKVLDGTMLTVKVACGKTISSWSFTSGTATLASGENPEYIGMEGDKEVYRFTIIPTSDVTLKVNFGNGAQRTISFLDGSTVLGQTKTAAITDKRDCDSYTLPAGYNTAGGDGGACTDWTFDGWTATNYTYGQMGAPEGIVAAGTSEDVHGDATWYAVYHKTYAAGAYFKLKYGTKYVSGYSSNQFTTSETEADGLMFGLENDYLYYIDKTTRGKVWVYYVNSTSQNVTTDTNKPTSNTYKTTFTEDNGTYKIVCNGKYLEKNTSDKVVFYETTNASRRGTRPDASGFTAYYPKTDCAIEYVTVTYDAGAGNSCTPASVTVESGSTFTLPVEADITYDKSDWIFVGWSESSVQGVVPGAPADLLAGGGSYSTFVDVTLHAVYSQTPPDGTFDNSKGGKYIIWGEEGGISYYAKSNGQKKGKLSNTLSCSEASIFEFVETETAGQYKIHIVGEDKYFAGEGCGDSNTDFVFVAAGSAPAWTVAETATAGVWKVTSSCGTRGFIMETGGSKIFGHYASNNTVVSPGSYKDIHIGQCDDYYTTNPNKALSVTGDILVTSTNGRMVMAKDQLTINAGNIGSDAPVTITSNSSDVYFSTTRAVNISKAEKPTNSVTINADGEGNITNQTVYVHYMPSVATDGIEEVLVTVTSPEKTVEHTIKVRHLPATFAIAAKVGKNWYALTGNMNGAKTPAAIQIEVDESSWTAYTPDTCAYQLWPVKTTAASGDRYQAQGEKVRFSAVNNKTTANAGLWANNSAASNTINNSAAITAISSAPDAQYEWKIAATEVSGTWKYTLQMEAGTNNNKLNIHRDANLVWGTYTDGQAVTGDIYLLPISEITPFEFQVVEWYPTKVLIQTEAALASPSVKIAGETVASPVLTNKGGKLWEISGLTTLAANPTEMLKINYSKDAVTYSGIKSIPVIISRSTQNVTAEPFTTLTKEVYNYADLVVRDGAVLTMNGTEAENKFYDVTIYPTSKISVPEGKKFGVHSLTFFGGIDEIYNGSTYTVNKYGVPELSLKGQFGTKTVTTIDYVMRVDLDQMYQTGVPYDVNLNEITYWDGTAMTPGTDLYVSTYDGQARANKESKTWIWEEDFESKLGAATLKAGVGYTISAELQSGVGSDYSIIRLPMKGNVGSNATEGDKTVPVVAYANTKGVEISDNHKGWNYLSNPYMVSISGGDPDSKLVVGYLKETGTGPWEWYNDSYRYVTIPIDNGTDYYQQKWTATTLKPFKSFFLQIGTAGDLSFALASRQNMPARYLQAKEREVEFEVLLSNASRTDNTGLLIAEKYSPAYEINADLEKMIGAMSIYTIYGGYNLAYNALSPADAEQLIPVGYVAPAAGEYSFALDEQGDYEQIEHIYLTDYEQSRTVDLLDDTYVFTTAAGKVENRFVINVILKPEQEEVATGTENIRMDNDMSVKFLYEEKIYILRNGVIYDATGKKVREINK